MSAASLNEFNVVAVPTQALARRLADLAASGAGSVANAIDDRRDEQRRRAARRDRDMDAALMELAVAVYRETQERLLTTFAIDRQASRLAIADIDRRLADLARDRADMIARAPKLEDGRAVFRSADGSLYAEDGERLSDDAAARFDSAHGDALDAGKTWEQQRANLEERLALERERTEIVEWNERQEEWQRQVETGEMTQEELEALEFQYEDSIPDRVRAYRSEAEATIDPAELEAAVAPINQPVAALTELPVLAEAATADSRAVTKAFAPG